MFSNHVDQIRPSWQTLKNSFTKKNPTNISEEGKKKKTPNNANGLILSRVDFSTPISSKPNSPNVEKLKIRNKTHVRSIRSSSKLLENSNTKRSKSPDNLVKPKNKITWPFKKKFDSLFRKGPVLAYPSDIHKRPKLKRRIGDKISSPVKLVATSNLSTIKKTIKNPNKTNANQTHEKARESYDEWENDVDEMYDNDCGGDNLHKLKPICCALFSINLPLNFENQKFSLKYLQMHYQRAKQYDTNSGIANKVQVTNNEVFYMGKTLLLKEYFKIQAFCDIDNVNICSNIHQAHQKVLSISQLCEPLKVKKFGENGSCKESSEIRFQRECSKLGNAIDNEQQLDECEEKLCQEIKLKSERDSSVTTIFTTDLSDIPDSVSAIYRKSFATKNNHELNKNDIKTCKEEETSKEKTVHPLKVDSSNKLQMKKNFETWSKHLPVFQSLENHEKPDEKNSSIKDGFLETEKKSNKALKPFVSTIFNPQKVRVRKIYSNISLNSKPEKQNNIKELKKYMPDENELLTENCVEKKPQPKPRKNSRSSVKLMSNENRSNANHARKYLELSPTNIISETIKYDAITSIDSRPLRGTQHNPSMKECAKAATLNNKEQYSPNYHPDITRNEVASLENESCLFNRNDNCETFRKNSPNQLFYGQMREEASYTISNFLPHNNHLEDNSVEDEHSLLNSEASNYIINYSENDLVEYNTNNNNKNNIKNKDGDKNNKTSNNSDENDNKVVKNSIFAKDIREILKEFDVFFSSLETSY